MTCAVCFVLVLGLVWGFLKVWDPKNGPSVNGDV